MNSSDAERVVGEELGRIAPDVDPAGINRAGDLREEFDIDSMDFLNLVIALNKRLGIPIPEADYPQLGSFQDVIAYVARKAP